MKAGEDAGSSPGLAIPQNKNAPGRTGGEVF